MQITLAMTVSYLIFEVCVLLAVCYGTYRAFLSKWGSRDDFSRVRLIAISVDCLLLTLVLLELHNLEYYASIIFNSPLLFLLCADSAIILAIATCLNSRLSMVIFSEYMYEEICYIIPYVNILLLNICILSGPLRHHCADAKLTELFDRVSTILLVLDRVHIFFIGIYILHAVLMIPVSIVLKCGAIRPQNRRMSLIVVSLYFSGPSTWLYSKAYSDTPVDFENQADMTSGYSTLLYGCMCYGLMSVWGFTVMKSERITSVVLCFIFVTFTMITSVCVMACTLDTPIPYGHCTTANCDLTASPRCVKIDRNDGRAIELSHLMYLQYLDLDREKHEMKIVNQIAGSWKKLAVLFNYNVEEIAGGFAPGGGLAVNCCLEVLGRWFEGGGTQRYPLSWNGLTKALRSVDLDRVAADIERALNCVVKNV